MNNHTPLEKKDLVSYLEDGCKPVSQWRIGLEHEKFGFIIDEDTLKPMPYEGPYGINMLLKSLAQEPYAQAIYDQENIVGISYSDDARSITLEPAGQLELSGAPLKSVTQVHQEITRHVKDLQKLQDGQRNFGFTPMGYNPKWSLHDIPLMPKSRYNIMRKYMKSVGTRGLQMMHMTSTVQVNLDYNSEQDMRSKMYVSTILQPIASALFANSPIEMGKISNYLSLRQWCWLDVDPHRSGLLTMAMDKSISFEKYTDFILKVPMYFIYRDGVYHDVAGQSFSTYLQKGFPHLKNINPILQDWKDHLTTAFPEVRLKQFIEMRGADSTDKDMLCALPALWVGGLYNSSALSDLTDLADTIKPSDLVAARQDIVTHALQAKIGKRTVQDIAKEMLSIASRGLEEQMPDDLTQGHNYLEPLLDIADTGITRSQRLIDEFKALNYDVDALLHAHDLLQNNDY